MDTRESQPSSWQDVGALGPHVSLRRSIRINEAKGWSGRQNAGDPSRRAYDLLVGATLDQFFQDFEFSTAELGAFTWGESGCVGSRHSCEQGIAEGKQGHVRTVGTPRAHSSSKERSESSRPFEGPAYFLGRCQGDRLCEVGGCGDPVSCVVERLGAQDQSLDEKGMCPQLTRAVAGFPPSLARSGSPQLGVSENWWREKFGFGFECVTRSEARYLEKSADARAIRDRLIEALARLRA